MNRTSMPLPIYILGFTLFAMTTSEYMVAGLMTSMSKDLGVSIPDIGYLITIYSLGMVFGGPLLATILVKMTNKNALLTITAIFLASTIIATFARSYDILAVGRFFAGLSSAAFFGFALLAATKLVSPSRFGVAASIVLGGMMIATVAGLPISTLLDRFYGWRIPFIFIIVLTVLSAIAIMLFLPDVQTKSNSSIRQEISSILNKSIWAAYCTSFFVIAATFATFSYFVPYFEQVVGFNAIHIPAILFTYGMCTVIGNFMVGRVADRAPIRTVFFGSIMLIVALLALYILHDQRYLVLAAVGLMGLTGLTLTPAMSSRVFKTAPNTSLINTMHTSVICFGVVLGSWGGGFAIDQGYGFRSPILIGIIFAACAVVSLVPMIYKNKYDDDVFPKSAKS